MTVALDQARAEESSLRARLAAAVTERARAAREADRLESRAALTNAEPAVSSAALAQHGLADQAAGRVESLRVALRRAEADVVTLEAALDAERAAQEH